MVPAPFPRSIRTSSSRRSSRTEQQRRKEVSQGFSNECPAFLLAQLDVYLYEELLGEGKEYRRGGRKGEGRRIDGRNCQLSGWPDGQLFGREMRKFVHSGGERGEECYLFRGGKLWFWRTMRNWYGFRLNKFRGVKYVENIYSVNQRSPWYSYRRIFFSNRRIANFFYPSIITFFIFLVNLTLPSFFPSFKLTIKPRIDTEATHNHGLPRFFVLCHGTNERNHGWSRVIDRGWKNGATRCHGRVQKRLGTRYRNAGVSWWGEGERRYVSLSLSPSLSPSLSFSLPPFVWSLRLEEQSTLAFAQDDKAYRLVGRIDVAQDSIRPRLSSRERMMAPSQLRLAGHPAGNESSFRRIEETWGQTRRETNGVRTEMNLNTCKSFSSFFPRSLIKLVELN